MKYDLLSNLRKANKRIKYARKSRKKSRKKSKKNVKKHRYSVPDILGNISSIVRKHKNSKIFKKTKVGKKI